MFLDNKNNKNNIKKLKIKRKESALFKPTISSLMKFGKENYSPLNEIKNKIKKIKTPLKENSPLSCIKEKIKLIKTPNNMKSKAITPSKSNIEIKKMLQKSITKQKEVFMNGLNLSDELNHIINMIKNNEINDSKKLFEDLEKDYLNDMKKIALYWRIKIQLSQFDNNEILINDLYTEALDELKKDSVDYNVIANVFILILGL